MASIASAVVPEPLAPRNFAAMMLAVQLTPATPTALLPDAPIVPATCVPWLLSSIGSHVFSSALYPCVPAAHAMATPPMVTLNGAGADQMLAVRSGWL